MSYWPKVLALALYMGLPSSRRPMRRLGMPNLQKSLASSSTMTYRTKRSPTPRAGSSSVSR